MYKNWNWEIEKIIKEIEKINPIYITDSFINQVKEILNIINKKNP